MHQKQTFGTLHQLTLWALASSMILLISCGGIEEPADFAVDTPSAPPPPKKVLYSRIAGSWYPADKEQLTRQLTGYLDQVDQAPLDDVQALMLPHAGYRFSGQTAAYGIKQIAGKSFQRVIVLGPSHRVAMRDQCSVPDVTHYGTPLGEVPLDLPFITALKKHPAFITEPSAHAAEHSVQIEVPLLQLVLENFELVPIVVGQLSPNASRQIAAILKEMIGPETLVVASTDFTHHGKGYNYVPFKSDVQASIEKLDMGAFEFVQTKDLDGFYRYIGKTGATICGRCPVAVLLSMLPEETDVHLLHYDTSGRIVNDPENSVSYLCAAFTGTWAEKSEGGNRPPSREATARSPLRSEDSERMGGEESEVLSSEEKEGLLKIARRTLTYVLENGKRPGLADLDMEITPGMKQTMGAFVTLNKRGHLRGCIGEIFPRRELYKAVIDHAINAGLKDHRFRPVQSAELAEIEFEISALTPPKRVTSYKDIVIGRHGVVIRKRGRQAVYLPQVAPEQGWDVEETLTHLSEKAGLPRDGWKSGAEFLVFEATVFHEGHK